MESVNPLIKWWVTPKLPSEDIFAKHNFITQWIIHPVKRRLARIWLRFLRMFGKIKVIGITGSTGKTTTTEILASILERNGKTVWSKVGVDPVYNIPNTILRCGFSTKYLILEMSVEYVNEMDYYLWLAVPDVGVITNIDSTHLKYLGSLQGVASEKGKMLKAISKSGTAVLNKDDEMCNSLINAISAKIIFFGKNAEVSFSGIKLNKDLSTDFILKLDDCTKNIHMNAYGKQFVDNALASAAVAKSLGINLLDIAMGINTFKRPPHRLNILKSSKYGLIFDDTYNSNPKAARESLDTFLSLSNGLDKFAVIGDMLELGNIEERAHRDLGKDVGDKGFTLLVGVGNAARYVIEEASIKIGNSNCFLAKDYREALEIIKPYLNKDTALFVKGSRSIHLDKLVEELIAS